MSKEHNYSLTIVWTGNKGKGTNSYRSFERSHTITSENKVPILASSDPAFLGDQTKHNPEELFLASISSCHMLWYLHLCAEAGIIVLNYTDEATGTMTETNCGGHFSEVTLNPTVTVAASSMIEKANELHKKANELCFIANSLSFPVRHKPICVVNPADASFIT
ncbi:OsmC family protein [Mucilaginibacter arboris]|uniref:OsmC family peroxiredoxin n=1 Tax=Mucilaginibacter arboris TaxID=2682090 RepID=A0A7K1SXA1_9SPHI|nr:OsmC family protein [Mucilaginibacter arboris]MVN21868.1 OsmC family peroxiredoxin [Mucilaginibacter arboris]